MGLMQTLAEAPDTLYLRIADAMARQIRTATPSRRERIPSVRNLAHQHGV